MLQSSQKLEKELVILNQACNYLTIGYANAFSQLGYRVILITGSIHVQGESLSSHVKVVTIAKWKEAPSWDKLVSYVKGLCQMWWLLMTKFRNAEVFFISVPPMAYLLNLTVPHKFSFMIWDVYPDIFKITGMTENHIIYRLWGFLNKRSFKKAEFIFTISDRMKFTLGQYVKLSKIEVHPIWSIFQEPLRISLNDNRFIEKHKLQNKFIIQYSGNIGLTHNVEVLIDLAEIIKTNKDILIQIIGRGPRISRLEKLVQEKNLPNCSFLPFQSDEMFPHSVSAAHLGVVILDEKVSRGSVPSKSYNLMALGIPSLYFCSSDSELSDYAKDFEHARCFEKAELLEAADFVKEVAMNEELWSRLSKNALKASEHFKRGNADNLVESYKVKMNVFND